MIVIVKTYWWVSESRQSKSRYSSHKRKTRDWNENWCCCYCCFFFSPASSTVEVHVQMYEKKNWIHGKNEHTQKHSSSQSDVAAAVAFFIVETNAINAVRTHWYLHTQRPYSLCGPYTSKHACNMLMFMSSQSLSASLFRLILTNTRIPMRWHTTLASYARSYVIALHLSSSLTLIACSASVLDKTCILTWNTPSTRRKRWMQKTTG